MFRRFVSCIVLLGCTGVAAAQGPAKWVEGTNYFRVQPPLPTTTPGKVEVLDVFSYACPACNQFEPILNKLKAALPAYAQMVYLPAAFNPQEDWVVFERGFLAAQVLGIADKSHDAVYDAVWGKGNLAVFDKENHLLPQAKLPTIQDLAKFYTAYGVKEADFLAVANSFSVDSKMKAADAEVRDYQVDGTPTVIVNGKYRVTPHSAGGYLETIDVVLFLVAQEKGR